MKARRGAASLLNLALAAGVCAATAGLVVLGTLATREWRRSSHEVLRRQADVTLTLLATALDRDMKGAQVSLLLPLQAEDLAADPPHDLRRTLAAHGFARFSYPEWFFIAHGAGARTWLFTRADRPPPWDASPRRDPYPVMMTRDAPSLRALVDEVRKRATAPARFVVFDWEIDERRYQIVATALRGGATAGLQDLAGFAVDYAWIREHYFDELLGEIARIGGHEEAVSLSIEGDSGTPVAATLPGTMPPPHAQRTFPLLFFDPAMRSLLPAGTATPAEWTATAAVKGQAWEATTQAAQRTLLLLSLAAAASLVGLLLTARAVQARAELAAMKSDFVATVTHELKAPLAVIRLAGDTLARGRYTSPETVGEYARLTSQEATRLARLIDNLLTYARVSDVQRDYRFEALDVAELVEDVVTRFRPRLVELGFETQVDVPLDLPRIRADRMAVFQVLDNVVDNAIKYSTAPTRALTVRARAEGAVVRLEVVDRGRGIPEAELPRIFDRFYRGRGAAPGGSGLGLAIVRRVIADHHGRVDVTSRVDEGTTFVLHLPTEAP